MLRVRERAGKPRAEKTGRAGHEHRTVDPEAVRHASLIGVRHRILDAYPYHSQVIWTGCRYGVCEGGRPLRRARNPDAGGDRVPAQADGRYRWPADPLAHHAAATPPTASATSCSASATAARSSRSTSCATTRSAPTSRSISRPATVECHRQAAEDWRVTLVDTGLDAMTGARVSACGATCGRRPLLRHLRRRPGGHRHRRPGRVPPQPTAGSAPSPASTRRRGSASS